ncbi:molybdopterin synthase [Halegenticoccus tardaugens]|uniref:molybdopterin synthase n=1 Tax=Halegenticoccus tardaugens TaxID=2071624 RepID=UPI00100BC563|nr:molybdopterin synthase [Halegenticoccus tardaugens]
MHVLSLVGSDADEAVARLVRRLDGRVATVERLPETDPDAETPGTTASYGLASDGSWVAAGAERPLDGLLDSLAPEYDYALVTGFDDARLPTAVVGDAEFEDERPDDARSDGALFVAESAAEADLDELAARLDDAEPRVTLGSLVDRVKRSPGADRAGAVATFTGRVRAKDAEDDARTVRLEFEKYEGVAEPRMEAIGREIASREGVEEVAMHHRTGVIDDGEDIVFVVVLADHREEAFRAVEDGINRLKDEVPIFKKETTVEEEFWVHDRE